MITCLEALQLMFVSSNQWATILTYHREGKPLNDNHCTPGYLDIKVIS